ncbi:putative soluble epoxide hydrolase [Rosa chinensis]|uniref:Putative soluble epoxide hydrolase n=1 Tax=Rosa chinensis TaxID=74649 RepID=A0A2P6Q3W9_ROSCH|nr:putative soluble epoxide hydrolase [Rosa chinensis]
MASSTKFLFKEDYFSDSHSLAPNMDQIEHKYKTVQGLKLHVADIGKGPNVVVFLHGFPDIWYTWRHQMIALANAGFRAIAPDYRGYGLSDPPPQPEKASFVDLDNDLLAILDALAIPKDLEFLLRLVQDKEACFSFVLGLHPERTLGVVTMGVPYMPKSSRPQYPEGFYVSRWQEPGGRAEADFGRIDAKTVIRNVYILF